MTVLGKPLKDKLFIVNISGEMSQLGGENNDLFQSRRCRNDVTASPNSEPKMQRTP